MPWYLSVLLVVGAPIVLLNWYVVRTVLNALKSAVPGRTVAVRRGVLFVVCWLNLLPVASLAAFLVAGRAATPAFNGDSPIVDALLVYPFWTWLVILVQLAVVFGVWHAISLLSVRFNLVSNERRVRAQGRLVIGAALVVAVYSIVTIVLNTATVRVVENEVQIPPEFSRLDGFRILHISDVQGDGRTTERKIAEFVRTGNALQPDVVLNSGDIVTSGERYITSTTDALRDLQGREGHYAAVGDHDIFSNKRLVLAGLRRNGITVADDTSLSLRWRNVPVRLTLVTYTYPQRPRMGKLDTLFNAPDTSFRILLIHQPARAVIQRAAEAGYQLALAGHTHGGGVAFGIPGLALVAPASFESPYLRGLYRVGSMVLEVTSGLGFTLAPIRFQAPLEMCLIVLRAGPTQAGAGS